MGRRIQRDLNFRWPEISGRSPNFNKGKVSNSMFFSLWRGEVGRRTAIVSACLALVAITQLVGAGKSPMKVLKYDPAAEKHEFFAALESGALSVRVVAHDVKGGHLYIENLSGKPLSVELPDAVAMVHVLKQVGNGNGFFGPGGNGNANGNGLASTGQQGGQQGGGQSIGGGFSQQQGNNTPGIGNGNGNGIGANPFNGNGNGIFSIPPERVAQVPYQSVCLNFGKPDPSPRMTYRPMRLEQYTQNEVLQETVRLFGTGRIDHMAAQAAAWHLTDKKSCSDLASLKEYTLPGVYSSQVPTFSQAQLQTAQELVTKVTQQVADRSKSKATPKSSAKFVVETKR